MKGYAVVDGIKIFYNVKGKGEPIILVHGNGLSHGQWKYNIEPLARDHEVYALDMPGFGQSDKPDSEYGLTYYMNFLKAFMDSMGISRPTIVGHSFGGAVAAGFAAKYSEDVTGIVLSDATGITPVGTRYNQALFKVLMNMMVRSRKVYCRPMFYNGIASSLLDDVQLVTDLSESRKAFMSNCREILQCDTAYTESIRTVSAPTLIVWGKNDMLLPVSDAVRYHELIPGSTMKLIDRCGHLPNVEKYQEFNDAVLDFLRAGHKNCIEKNF